MNTEASSPAGRSASLGFVVAMLGCLLAPGVAQIASSLGSRGLQSAPSAADESSTALVSDSAKELLQGLEQRLESTSPFLRWANRVYAPAIDEALKRGNSRVLFGRRNWLFYRPAVSYVTGPAMGADRAERLLEIPDDFGDPAEAIIDFRRQLQAADVELLVVPVPVKVTLYPERLWQGAEPMSAPNNPGFGRFIERLEAAKVPVLDLAPIFLEAKSQGLQIFLPRDTHWTPEAMFLAADAVTARVRSLLPDLGESSPFDHRQVTFEGSGDIYDMLAYAPWRRRSRPMRFAVHQVVADRQGREPRSTASQILLLGDSLTNVFSSSELGLGRRGGFAEHLALRLERPVDVIAMPAGGASRSRKALALRPRPLQGKRLVIWQFTQRDLLFAGEGWDAAPLPEKRESSEPAGAEKQRNELLAWVVDTTPLPRTMDYPDCLVVSQFRRVDGDLPGAGDLFTMAWGIRDGQPLPAAGFKKRSFYRLVLEPLPADIDLEKACWLDTVGMDTRPWWIVKADLR